MGIPTAFNDSDTPAGQVLPAGQYEVEVVKAVPREAGENAKHAGETYLRLELQPTDENMKDERFFLNLNFWPESKRFLHRDLLALGYADAEIKKDGFEVEEEALVGRKCVASVKIRSSEEYGEQNEVRALMPLGGGTTAGGTFPT